MKKIIIINKVVFFKYLNIVFFSISKVKVPLIYFVSFWHFCTKSLVFKKKKRDFHVTQNNVKRPKKEV